LGGAGFGDLPASISIVPGEEEFAGTDNEISSRPLQAEFLEVMVGIARQ
jgi:hypothetical protein